MEAPRGTAQRAHRALAVWERSQLHARGDVARSRPGARAARRTRAGAGRPLLPQANTAGAAPTGRPRAAEAVLVLSARLAADRRPPPAGRLRRARAASSP